MTRKDYHEAPTGYLKVADAAEILDKSREWVYRLIEDGKIAVEERRVEGGGIRQIKLVTLESFIAYVRSAATFDGQRVAIINKARAASTKIKAREFSDADKAAIKARYEAGDSLEDLSRAERCAASTIASLLREMNVEILGLADRFQATREAFAESIDPVVRLQIQTLHKQGWSPLAIAKEIGWGRSRVNDVRRALLGMGETLRGRAEAQSLSWSRRMAAPNDGT